MLFFLFFFLKPINKSILAKEGIKEKTLLNWHKAIAHITRCTQAAVYFLKFFLPLAKLNIGPVFSHLKRVYWGAVTRRK